MSIVGPAGPRGPAGPTGPAGSPANLSNAPLSFSAFFARPLNGTPYAAGKFVPDNPITVTRVTANVQSLGDLSCSQAVLRLSDGTKGQDIYVSANQTEVDSGSGTLTFAAGAGLRASVRSRSFCAPNRAGASSANVIVQYRTQTSADRDACPSGQTSCGGICESTSLDLDNCGACGKVCTFVNATPACSAGACSFACTPGFANCSGNPATGCETISNACGGCAPLPASPVLGAACGTCGNGTVDCNGPNAVACLGAAIGVNQCGGCAFLPGFAPGRACGTCGMLACSGTNDFVCAGEHPRNACGGCATLTGSPGTACGTCGGNLACSGTEAVVCNRPTNACGGCSTLTGPPLGTSCGTCGSVACTGTNATVCAGEHPRNACGGCATLTGSPGTACGTCGGKLACSGTEAVVCNRPTNACGGCSVLSGVPGLSCGFLKTLVCTGPDSLVCR